MSAFYGPLSVFHDLPPDILSTVLAVRYAYLPGFPEGEIEGKTG